MHAVARLTGNMLRKKSKILPMTIGATTPDTTFFLPKYKNITSPKHKLNTALKTGMRANKSKIAAMIKTGQYLPNFFVKDIMARGSAGVALKTLLAKMAAFLA